MKKNAYQFYLIFSKLINYIDFFRIGVNFNFKSQNKSSTTIGKFFTFMILFLLTFTIMTSDMIQKKNPNVINQQIEIQERPKIILDSNNYTTVFSVSDDENSNYLMDKTIWSFEVLHRVIKNDGSLFNETIIPIHLCNSDDFIRKPENYHKYKFEKNAYCLSNKKIELSGYWDETEVSYFNININKCVNTTDSDIICKSNEEINSFFSNKYFGAWLERTTIEIQNYEKPINYLMQIYYETIDNRFCKALYLFLQKTFLYTNNGIFYNQIESIETFSNGDTKISYSGPRNQTIFAFVLYSDDKIRYISRNYQQIGDLFGKIGGLANILIVFGFILAKFENSLNVTNSVINNLYKFQIIKNGRSNTKISNKLDKITINSKNQVENKTMIEKNKSNRCKSKINNFLAWFQIRKIFNIKSKIDKVIKLSRKKIKVGIFKYIFLLLSPSNRKNKKDILFLKGEKNLKKDLDLVNVLRKLQDVDRLKSILLDETQKLLFDFIAKPLITFDNENSNFENKLSKKIGYLEKDNLMKHYDLLKHKKSKSKVDLRILALLDRNFEKTMENLGKKRKLFLLKMN